jgi:putative DNA primase/helicase
MVKELVGSRTLNAAFKGKDNFDFLPRFKVTLTSNFDLNADADDSAIWNRPMLISFPHERRETEQEDKNLKDDFLQPEQQEAILKWVVDGAVRWYSVGLVIPQSFRNDKQQQRGRLDMVKQWLLDNVDKVEDVNVRLCSEVAISNYTDWCKLNSVEPKRGRSFADAMKIKGHKSERGDGRTCRFYRGLKLAVEYHHDRGEIIAVVATVKESKPELPPMPIVPPCDDFDLDCDPE